MPETVSTTTDDEIRRLKDTVNELKEQVSRGFSRGISRGMTLEDRADSEIKMYYGGWAALAGVLPPVVDVAAVTAVQLRLIRRLATIYDREREYDDKSGRAFLAALAAAAAPALATYAGAPLLVKWIPLVGPPLGMVMTPVLNYGATQFVGQYAKNLFKEGKSLSDPIEGVRVNAALAAGAKP